MQNITDLPCTIFCFFLIDFWSNTDFPSQFESITNHLADRFLKKMFLKRAKTRRLFRKTIGSNNSFTLIEKQFQVFEVAI